ncbi:MAG: GGDEF domain-containing protein, partial [Burkholderiales bacterium]|nr:GGDEF domain-containing protein [Burkholderiales bacterium]
AAMLAAGRSGEDAGTLQLAGGAVALAALAPGVAWMAGAGVPAAGGLDLRALAAVAPLAVVAFALLAMMNERTERELGESRQRLQVLAYTDALTGIANRRHFELLAARVLHARHAPVLLLFDIDHFKAINDRLGHAAGDRALQLVGQGLRETLRAGDIAGRLGGDEFALLLADASLRQAVAVADRLLQRIQTLAPAQRLPRLGLSFGLVQTRPGEAVDDALRRADQALYEAKRQGRSCAVTAQGEEHRPVFSESQRLGLTEA